MYVHIIFREDHFYNNIIYHKQNVCRSETTRGGILFCYE